MPFIFDIWHRYCSGNILFSFSSMAFRLLLKSRILFCHSFFVEVISLVMECSRVYVYEYGREWECEHARHLWLPVHTIFSTAQNKNKTWKFVCGVTTLLSRAICLYHLKILQTHFHTKETNKWTNESSRREREKELIKFKKWDTYNKSFN